MRRAAQVLMGAVLLSLVTTFVPAAATVASSDRPSAARAAPVRAPWTPPNGVVLNQPDVDGHRRDILDRVVRTIDETQPLEHIRIVVWNLDDGAVVNALIRARERLVTVQVVVSAGVDNPNWDRLKANFDQDRTDDNFARKCSRACRSAGPITHAKFFLFSRVNTAPHVSMFGSTNLATPAGYRQWNDLVTTDQASLYDYWVQKFDEFAADEALPSPYEVRSFPPYRSTLFPAAPRNPVVDELQRVRCTGTTGGTGNAAHRTVIRIAIAGWFDAYGSDIAKRLRQMWDRGCDLKIVTTLAGRGVNRIMRASGGRGPVPMREVTLDTNHDAIPEKYLHLKSLSISGVYAGDTSASVIFTGSPNWSERAQRSDELWVRILDRPGMVRQYRDHVNMLYAKRFAHTRAADGGTGLRRSATGATITPDWFDAD